MLVIMTGPSGSGKSTVAARVLDAIPRLRFSVSHTTRAQRPGEVDGEAYHFVDEATFVGMIEGGAFAEHAEVHGKRYGTSTAEIERLGAAGFDVLFDVDVQGAAQLMERYPDAVSLFFLPPSVAVMEQRLRGRGTESEEQVQVRLTNARDELEHAERFTYVVVNDDVEVAVAELSAIVRAERCRRPRRQGIIDSLRAEKSA